MEGCRKWSISSVIFDFATASHIVLGRKSVGLHKLTSFFREGNGCAGVETTGKSRHDSDNRNIEGGAVVHIVPEFCMSSGVLWIVSFLGLQPRGELGRETNHRMMLFFDLSTLISTVVVIPVVLRQYKFLRTIS